MMDISTVRQALDIARFYPSGENCQCFRFRFINQQLLVDYVADEASHALIYDGSLISLTLGGLAEYLRNAFAELGYECHFQFCWKEFDCHRDHPAIARLRFQPLPEGRSALPLFSATTLLERVTDRRKYLPPTNGDITAIASVLPWRYLKCHVLETLTDEATADLSHCESHIWHAEQIVKDITSAVHFDTVHPQTGLPWNNLGVSRYEVLPIKWVKAYPGVIDAFRLLGMQYLMYQSQLELWRSSRSAIVFTYADNLTQAEKTNASMEMMRLILALTEAGYAMQPSTISTEVLNITHKPTKNLQTEAGYSMPQLAARSWLLQQRLHLPDAEVAWVLRVGRPESPFPEEARTKRLPLERLLV